MAQNPYLYSQILAFYAAQVRRVDGQDINGFAETFTRDGFIEHRPGERVQGREAMLADMQNRLPGYEGLTTKHWFGQVIVDETDGAISTEYYASLTIANDKGELRLAGTFSVNDVLVRDGESFLVRERKIVPDLPKRK